MSQMSDYLETALNNHVLGNVPWSKPGTVYIALCTSAPSDSSMGSEVSGSGYSRLLVTNNGTNWGSAHATTGLKTNAVQFTFPTATGNWGTITHWAILDAASGGNNMLYWGTFSSPKTILSGDTPRFPSGDISITFVSGSNYLDKTLNDLVLGAGTFTAPSTVYLGLHTGDPGEDGTANELTIGTDGYARASIANNTTNFPNATSGTGQKQNGTALVFPTATGSWGTITHLSIWSAATAGNLLYQGPMDVSKAIGTGDTPRFLTGELKVIYA